jgi:hypothetical protein
MINPIFTPSPPACIDEEDAGFSSFWSLTEDEHRLIKELQNIEQREVALQQFLRYGSGPEPSVVLDDFLFLGNIHQGSNLELLERFKIGKLKTTLLNLI